jgi:ABC-2 type transport system permease protein
MGAYGAFFSTSKKEEFRYFFTDSVVQTFSTLTYITLTLVLYAATGSSKFFGIFTWSMIVWYIIATQMIGRTNGHLVATISKDVVSGDIANLMLRPVYYPFALVAMQFGEGFVQAAALLLVVIPFGLVVGGSGPLTFIATVAFLFALIGSMLLNCAIALSLGLLAFWTEDAKPFDWIYNKFLLVLGGVIFPLDLLPGVWQTTAKLLPPAFLAYYPARLLVDFSWDLFWKVLVGQLLYIALFGSLAVLIYKRAVRKVTINGG